MNIAHSSGVKKTIAGTCPHGLPYAACPICSGMGGGGRLKKSNKPTNEMSWSECYAIWQKILKAKDIARKEKLETFQTQIGFSQKIGNIAIKIANFVDKLANAAGKMQNLPKIISKPIVLTTKILIPVLNLAKNVFVLTQNALNVIQQKFVDISDKLTTVYGEMKNFIEKNISEKFGNFKKKIKSLFGIFEPEETEDVNEEEKQIEESKRLFEMKTVIQTMKEKFSKKEEIENGYDD